MSLGTRVVPRSLREQCAGLFTWWVRELRDTGEAVLARILPGLASRTVVHLKGSPFDAQPVEVLPELQSGTRIVLALDPKQVLTFDVTVPSVVERDLRSAMGLYLERELPISTDRVHLDMRVKRRDRTSRTIMAELVLVHRSLVERVCRPLSDAGLRIVRVGVQRDGEVIGNLLPRRTRLEQLRMTDLDRRLAAAAAVLAAAVAVVIGAQWAFERYQIAKELSRVQAAAATARALALRYERESRPIADLAELMARPDASDVLTALTKRIPDPSWLYEVEVLPQPGDTMHVKMGGFVPTATVFTDMLAKETEFQDVRLLSASSAGLGSGKDRVQLTARWRAK